MKCTSLVLLAASVMLSSSLSLANIEEDSYICLATNTSLCFGVSPGSEDGNHNLPFAGLYLQLKSRIKNEAKGADYNKMRWHIDYENGNAYLSITQDPKLCITKKGQDDGEHVDNLWIQPCVEGEPSQKFSFDSLNGDGDDAVKLKYSSAPNKCIGVLSCNRANGAYCNRNEEDLETGVFEKGSYLKVVNCGQINVNKMGFTNEVDCAVNCVFGMVGNGVCDQACRTQACEWDGGECNTPSPTNPTMAPTPLPTVVPTSAPSAVPTVSPTSVPTVSPTSGPTAAPTPPTSSPTVVPTLSPTVPTAERQKIEEGDPIEEPDSGVSVGAVVGICAGVVVVVGGAFYSYKKSQEPPSEASEFKGDVPMSPSEDNIGVAAV